jgi:S-adenosylmethionine:tRNA ribosyltransferase-isomerase
MRVDQFDFDLPEALIALRPAEPRDSARLLVLQSGKSVLDSHVNKLPDFLKSGDLLVFNDTKVIPAQLEGIRVRGENRSKVSATLHMRTAPDRWLAFLRPAKRVAAGDSLVFGGLKDSSLLGALMAKVVSRGSDGEALLAFERSGPALDDAIRSVGHVPLPPYIALKRGEDDRDKADYQTVYARHDGAVAAPTAGLHFMPELLAKLQAKGVKHTFVTLHVGAGTFLPVKADDTDNHKMHAEIGHIGQAAADTINAARASGGRVIAVGTTSLRLLESAADEYGTVRSWSGPTDIFITPGYRFRAIDGLMTNFHLPKSTLFMLVSAFMGTERMKEAYEHAIRSGYRFYSYGDASLLFP